MRKALLVDGAAKLGGHYSHAVIANGFVYVSGQGPADPKSGIAPDSFAEQVRQTLRNVLEEQDQWRVCAEAADGVDAVRKME